MIDPEVRPASPADAPQLRTLEAEARAALSGQRGGDRWLATHPERGPAWPDRIVAGGVHLAHVDSVVVGYIVVACDTSIARVEEVYVTPEARQLGFGDALLEAALAEARLAGCTMLEGEALPGDRDTKNLYERAGITARLILLSTPL